MSILCLLVNYITFGDKVLTCIKKKVLENVLEKDFLKSGNPATSILIWDHIEALFVSTVLEIHVFPFMLKFCVDG